MEKGESPQPRSEDGCWWELLLTANYDHLPGTNNGRHSIFWEDLGRFDEDDHIEVDAFGADVRTMVMSDA